MRIIVVAKAGSKHASIEKINNTRYIVSVTAPPEHGKANEAIRRALASELRIAPSRISCIMGATAKIKIFSIQ